MYKIKVLKSRSETILEDKTNNFLKDLEEDESFAFVDLAYSSIGDISSQNYSVCITYRTIHKRKILNEKTKK